jgi:hypothetical protein
VHAKLLSDDLAVHVVETMKWSVDGKPVTQPKAKGRRKKQSLDVNADKRARVQRNAKMQRSRARTEASNASGVDVKAPQLPKNLALATPNQAKQVFSSLHADIKQRDAKAAENEPTFAVLPDQS